MAGYYDFDSWSRQNHDENIDECVCLDCRERASEQLADHMYDMWHDDRGA